LYHSGLECLHERQRHGGLISLRYRRSHPADCPGCEHGTVPVASRYGAIFAVTRAGYFAIAVQGDS
jgi:hypothetical protein